jgi:DNA-binding beta-propeller fold protein YncE
MDPLKTQTIALPDNSYPYSALLTKDEKRLIVSLWGAEGVAVVNVRTLKVETTWKTNSHPTEMILSPDEAFLYVACSNSNTVNVIETKSGEIRHRSDLPK